MSNPPEIWTFVGINIFIMLSLVMHYYKAGNRSGPFPSIYQLIASEGVAQMYFTNFVFGVDLEVRKVLSVAYFAVAMANVGLTMLVVHKRNAQTGKTSPRHAEEAKEAGNTYALKDFGKGSVDLPKFASEPVKETPKTPRRRTTRPTNKDRGDSAEDLIARACRLLEDEER